MTIRPATLADHPSIAALTGELGYPTTTEAMLARMQMRPETEAVFVATTDHEVIAWIQTGITWSLEAGSFAEIRGLVVAASHRSGGIGASLVAAAEQWATSRGMDRLRVRSNVIRERTHRFYERLGFTLTKSQKTFDKKLA
jgi:GNAT superfamily N-acetyltransferase